MGSTSNGERPANGKFVLVMPKGQGVTSGYTNADGMIAFSFLPTESVTFRVGTIANNVRLQPLSGRLTQNTSFLDDKRIKSRNAYVAYEPTLFSMTEVLEDFESQAGGRLMNEQSREYLRSLRETIIEITTPKPDADNLERERQAENRTQLLKKLDDLLAAPWKMRASYDDDPQGARITDVASGGPAANAGIKVGDVITRVNGLEIVDFGQTFRWMIANAEKSNVELTVMNGNAVRNVMVSLVR